MTDPQIERGAGQTPGVPPTNGPLSRTVVGLLTGLVLGAVAALGGFGAFVIVVLFGGIGLIVGLQLDGRIDVASLVGRVTERR